MALAKNFLSRLLELCVNHRPGDSAALIFDERSTLSRVLAAAYREALPGAAAFDFDRVDPEEIKRSLEERLPGSLVVLVESSRFPLAGHRLRIELFRRGLKVIEHPHLERVGESEVETYLESLDYDATYYRSTGARLKEKIGRAGTILLVGDGHRLEYRGGFEEVKLNVGDYSGMASIGGQFPIGEVFTEPKDLTSVNGDIGLFAFGDRDFSVNAPPKPIVVRVVAGEIVESPGAPDSFLAVLEEIRQAEGRVWLRELGFGLNRAFTRSRRVSDVGSYERMCGVHLSLGAKHAIYPKEGFRKKQAKFHVDVFAAVDEVSIEGETVYREGRYVIG